VEKGKGGIEGFERVAAYPRLSMIAFLAAPLRSLTYCSRIKNLLLYQLRYAQLRTASRGFIHLDLPLQF
jgi:hypothetical protein